MTSKYFTAVIILILAGVGVFCFPVVTAIFMLFLALFIFVSKSLTLGYWKAFLDLLKSLFCDW
jgi:hypothetical protein